MGVRMDWEMLDIVWLLVGLGLAILAHEFVRGLGSAAWERWESGSMANRIDDLEQRLEAAFDAMEKRIAELEKPKRGQRK